MSRGSLPGPFLPYIFVGGPERGICYAADNDRDWINDPTPPLTGGSLNFIPLNQPPNIQDRLDVARSGSLGFNYAQRISGSVTPEKTDEYIFRISGDDQCELRIALPGEKMKRIALVRESTEVNQWTKYPEQTSPKISLTARQAYPIEILHKQGGGGDPCGGVADGARRSR